MDKRYQIFVSSTFGDLQDERKAVLDLVQGIGHIPAGMEYFPAENAEAVELIKSIIDRSDYYLLIVAGKYGSVHASGVSYTELEYDYAYEKKLHVIPLIFKDLAQRTVAQSETDPDKAQKLAAFIAKIESRHHRKTWGSKDELLRVVTQALLHAMQVHPAVGWIRGDAQGTIAELQMRLNESLKYVELLRQQNAEINRQLEQFTEWESIADLCQGDDPIELEFDVTVMASDSQARSTFVRKLTTTWSDVFSAIAGEIFAGGRRQLIVDAISARYRPLIIEQANIVSRLVRSDTVDRVRNQLLALQVIQLVTETENTRHFGRMTREEWIVTPFGQKFLAPYVAALKNTEGIVSSQTRTSNDKPGANE